MARPAKELSVTHRFTVELTDYLESNGVASSTLMTREEAREVLDQVLYRGDKHTAFTLRLVSEEAHDG